MPEQPEEFISGLEKIGADLRPDDDCKPDEASKKEAQVLFGDKRRNETLKEVVHGVFIWFIRIAAFSFMLVLLVRVLHFILPEAKAESSGWWPHGWLSETQLQAVDKLFFSGAMGAMISRYLKGVFSEKGGE